MSYNIWYSLVVFCARCVFRGLYMLITPECITATKLYCRDHKTSAISHFKILGLIRKYLLLSLKDSHCDGKQLYGFPLEWGFLSTEEGGLRGTEQPFTPNLGNRA